MEPVSLAAGMVASRLGAVRQISPIRGRRTEGASEGNANAGTSAGPANRRANLPDHLGQNLDITV